MDDKKKKMIVSLIVFGISLTTYLLTVAPTVSFWDCGEFIACANILGIPHPPGTPMFMLLGRFFILIFGFVNEIAFRVNLISVFSSALGVMFTFMFAEKLIVLAFKSTKTTFTSIVGGVVAAMLLNFSDTYWFNAVEAEVYGLAMCLVMIICWLSLKWVENRGTAAGDRYLLLICYLAFFGVGFHLYSVMTFPAILLLMFLLERDPSQSTFDSILKFAYKNYVILISGVGLLSVIYKVSSFPFIAAVIFVLWTVLFFMATDIVQKEKFKLGMWFCLLAIIGYSTHAYIPIRSALNPRIDENNPELALKDIFNSEARAAYDGFVERKQYGSESMLKRAMHRRGDVMNQVFSHPHMGYGGYMLAQYLPWKVGEGRSSIVDNRYKGTPKFDRDPDDNDPVERFGIKFNTQMTIMPPTTHRGTQVMWFFLFHIPMLVGIWFVIKRNKPIGIYMITLYILASAGLIFYMNFSDGLRPDLGPYNQWVSQGANPANPPQPVYMEVRERDYFYAPGYMFMSVLFGLSAALLVNFLREKRKGLLKPVGTSLIVLSFIVPAVSNYHEHDRSKIFVPYDYAKNLLESCLPNSVLFTNGDNDTFPLWFMQEVENVRKDVRVVNLSLVNTNWYVHQLIENEPKLVLGFTPDKIDLLAPQPNSLQAPQTISVGNTGLKVTLEARDKKPYYKVQDLMVMNIIQNNWPERPIHFAVTVSNPNMMGFEKYMQMEGMVYTLTDKEKNQELEPVRTASLVDNVYHYRGLDETPGYLNSDTRGLLSNYFATNHRLTRWAQEQITKLDQEKATLTSDTSSVGNDSLANQKKVRLEEIEKERAEKVAFAEKYIAKTEKIMSWDWRHYYFSSQFYRSLKDYDKAVALLEKGLTLGKYEDVIGSQLGQIYMEQEKYPEAAKLFEKIIEKSPEDFQATNALSDVYEKQNKLEDAKNLLNKFLEENPTHQYASYFKNKILGIDTRARQAQEEPEKDPFPGLQDSGAKSDAAPEQSESSVADKDS